MRNDATAPEPPGSKHLIELLLFRAVELTDRDMGTRDSARRQRLRQIVLHDANAGAVGDGERGGLLRLVPAGSQSDRAAG